MPKITEWSLQKLDHYHIVDFAYCEELEAPSYESYQNWLKINLQGDLHYLEGDNEDKRQNLNKVYEGCQSALVFLFSHLQVKKHLFEKNYPRSIASFVMGYEGLDYHTHIRESLEHLKAEYLPLIEGRICVDTFPILERDLASRSGLGFIGKNSMLIHPKWGSHVMIGIILLKQRLPYPIRPIIPSQCGDCINCLSACPTQALFKEQMIDSRKCISSYTIETRKDVFPPQGYRGQTFIFGCDRCQDVCPLNKKALELVHPDMTGEKASIIEQFFLIRDLPEIMEDLNQMSNKSYQRLFKGTSLERTGRLGMLKNLKNLL